MTELAEDQVTVITTLLTAIHERIAVLETNVANLSDRIDKYNNVTGRTSSVETEISLIKQQCKQFHEADSKSKVSWGTVKGSVLGGVTVGVIMLLINYLAR